MIRQSEALFRTTQLTPPTQIMKSEPPAAVPATRYTPTPADKALVVALATQPIGKVGFDDESLMTRLVAANRDNIQAAVQNALSKPDQGNWCQTHGPEESQILWLCPQVKCMLGDEETNVSISLHIRKGKVCETALYVHTVPSARIVQKWRALAAAA